MINGDYIPGCMEVIMEVLENDMPCVFKDEEFEEELRLSEESGCASEQELISCFGKWTL